MPANYTLFPAFKLKYVSISESVELDELLDLAKQYFDDPCYDPQNRFLVDATLLRRSSGRFRDAFQLYSFYKRMLGAHPEPLNVAIVAPGDFAYGLSHMFVALSKVSSFMNVKIFSTMDEGFDWLELDKADVCQCDREEKCLVH